MVKNVIANLHVGLMKAEVRVNRSIEHACDGGKG
jgi:hypothetical protein